MGLFKHDARVLKFDILREIAEETFNGTLTDESISQYIKKLTPGNKTQFRCCIYKEREILRQRARLSMGKMANDETTHHPKQIVQVINAACDGCTIKKIQVTDNCRKCMAKNCMAACNFGAISMGTNRAEIDYDKCKECGACARSCPFNAIVITERPCKASCPVDAISYDEDGIALINEDKCINCGRCQAACPFGAIDDISWIVPVVELLKMNTKMVAMIAPSIQGQFSNTSIGQFKKAIKMLGFDEVVEAAVGADIVAYYEHEELKEHIEKGIPMTTSCCPAFVNMAKIHFPEVYKNNVSTMVSPMMATASLLKKQYPDHGIVFIGPCLAKKQEAMEEFTSVDYVLTFEELAAMLIAKKIHPSELEVEEEKMVSNYGRNFAQGGGVSKAVVEVSKEKGEDNFTSYYADGAFDCKKQLLLMKLGKFPYQILEGMCCDGGCINGPCTVEDAIVVKGRMNKENVGRESTICDSMKYYKVEESDLALHREK